MIRPSDVTNRPEWMLRGACRGKDPNIFYPLSSNDLPPAKVVCGGCAVRSECLDYALARGEVWGVWGGLSEKERRRIRSRRRAS